MQKLLRLFSPNLMERWHMGQEETIRFWC